VGPSRLPAFVFGNLAVVSFQLIGDLVLLEKDFSRPGNCKGVSCKCRNPCKNHDQVPVHPRVVDKLLAVPTT
jgi:hypothetical protein